MTPLEKRAKAAQWRALWAMQERWERTESTYSPTQCAKELREYLLSLGVPPSPGRPRKLTWP